MMTRRFQHPLSARLRLGAAISLALAAAVPGRAAEPMSLNQATAIAREALAQARKAGLRPMSVVVLDADGGIRVALREDGVGRGAFELTVSKAQTAYDYRLPTRVLGAAFANDPGKSVAMATARQGHFMIIAGGRPIFDAEGHMIGAAAAGGDKPDNDDATILAAISAVGLKGEPPAEAKPSAWK